jgi:hypothetical protein
MYPHVFLEAAAKSKTLVTNITRVRLLPCVCPYVRLETARLHERHPAHITFVGTFSRVKIFVGGCRKTTAADITDIGFIPSV